MFRTISFFFACAAVVGTAHGSGCATAFIGEQTDDVRHLPQSIIPAGQREAVIDIPDHCSPAALVGEQATVCDYITAPDIHLGPDFSHLTVHRTNDLDDAAYVEVIQYCRP